MARASSAVEISSLVRHLVVAAASVAADRRADGEVRRNHAGLAYSLSHHVGPDEEVCSEVVRAAQMSLDDRRVVRNLLEAAVALAPDQGRLRIPIRRLCAGAYDAGMHKTLLVGLTWLARIVVDDRDGEVPFEWFAALSSVGVRRPPYFVRSWVERSALGTRDSGRWFATARNACLRPS